VDIDTRARRAGLPAASVGVTELYQAHAVGLIKLGVIMLGDRTAAEDVVQDAFFGLYRNWGRLSDPDNALAYARASVLNGCRAALRQRIRRERRLSVVADAATTESAESAVLLGEEHREVLAAVRRLPDRKREALVLRFYLGVSEEETARAMGISRGTVKSSTSRALAALGRMLKEETFSQPAGDTTKPVGIELRETLTGKTLDTLQPPRGLSFAGISGAADDRTFVADAHREPYGVPGSMARSRTWDLVRVAGTGSGASLTMTELPIPATQVGAEVLGIALSPDGTKLAVGTTPWTTATNVRQTLRVYSVATGAVLRTWTTPPGAEVIQPAGGYGGDPNSSLSWTSNRTLAFLKAVRAAGSPAFRMQMMTLDISHPDGDLLGSSRPTITMPVALPDPAAPAPFGCGLNFRFNILVTGDGKSFVCGGTGTTGASLPTSLCAQGSAWNTLAFGEYSFAGGPARYIGYRTTCNSLAVVAYPLWVNATGSEVIGWMHFANSIPGRFGVFSNGSFRPLPIPVPGNWYQWDDGSLLYQVAW